MNDYEKIKRLHWDLRIESRALCAQVEASKIQDGYAEMRAFTSIGMIGGFREVMRAMEEMWPELKDQP